jgi:hypothetical protein
LRQVAVTYLPVMPSAGDDASFVVEGPAVPAQVSLRGRGVQAAIEITPDPLDFLFVQPCNSRSLPLRLSNVGSEAIDVTAVTIANPGSPAAFSIANGSWTGGVLMPGDTKEVQVSFGPTTLDKYVGELDVSTNGSSNIVPIALQGFGGGAVITSTPSQLDFGIVACGDATLPIICTNTGTDVMGGDGGAGDVPFWWSATSSPPNVCVLLGPDAGTLGVAQSIELDVQCNCPPGFDGGPVTITISEPSACELKTNLTVNGPCACN